MALKRSFLWAARPVIEAVTAETWQKVRDTTPVRHGIPIYVAEGPEGVLVAHVENGLDILADHDQLAYRRVLREVNGIIVASNDRLSPAVWRTIRVCVCDIPSTLWENPLAICTNLVFAATELRAWAAVGSPERTWGFDDRVRDIALRRMIRFARIVNVTTDGVAFIDSEFAKRAAQTNGFRHRRRPSG